MASSSKGADEANLQVVLKEMTKVPMVMFMDDVRYFQSFTIFTTNSYRHRTLYLECTEKTFLPGVRIGEGKRCAHRLTQLYFAKNS
jgi:hypothetical protein